MSALGIYQIVFYFIVVLALTKPVGLFMARLFEGERTFLHPLLRPVERLFYKLSGVREDVEQHWTAYAGAFLAFHVAKFVVVYAIMRLQGWLPLNPMGFSTAPRAVERDAHDGRPRLQHGRQLPDEHQLAVVRRRDDDELLHADGGAGGAELHVRRQRHRHCHRADAWFCAGRSRRRSATSGSI